MGGKPTKEQRAKQREKYLFDTKKIYYNADGNLIYDRSINERDIDAEVRKIIEVDIVTDEPGKIFYAMDTAWINSWLAYTFHAKGVSPNPGPCKNNRLITLNADKTEWIVREDIFMASSNWKGDYRRVSEEAWKVFVAAYPGSGPALSFEFLPENQEKGAKLIPQNWKIYDSPATPGIKNKETVTLAALTETISLINNVDYESEGGSFEKSSESFSKKQAIVSPSQTTTKYENLSSE